MTSHFPLLVDVPNFAFLGSARANSSHCLIHTLQFSAIPTQGLLMIT
jgi:hypothetical protein